ncbi:hypothetical protein SAMN06264364_12376 [Quadrisphaera granulorum]|uniref:Uncharacterized protein n=1 Tax=Quadrisphaera granulorum TaxID=317664 RepID=A0A315ZX91_9ACTN|nr:hypothetical protein [Quadrisphaera granulorum]PWJ50266.1 hypothetical protein BXY45_12376 [Quadrisphaera granulorum]SZE98032.1 hypothetical protein SAMN06264364_12376 [Quadrisphaera granulorum]
MSLLRRLAGRLDRALGSVEQNLKAVYGGAQVDKQQAGTQAARAEHRLSGVRGEFEMHRDATGRTYLVTKPPAGKALD